LSIFSCGLTTLQFLTLCSGVNALFKLDIVLVSISGFITFFKGHIIGSFQTTHLNSCGHASILFFIHSNIPGFFFITGLIGS